jgi:hypothetical protein
MYSVVVPVDVVQPVVPQVVPQVVPPVVVHQKVSDFSVAEN